MQLNTGLTPMVSLYLIIYIFTVLNLKATLVQYARFAILVQLTSVYACQVLYQLVEEGTTDLLLFGGVQD